MENIIKRLGNLLSVKSIVTLGLTIIFAVLALRGDISGKDFLTIFLTVITFYFGTQSQKTRDGRAPQGARGLKLLLLPLTLNLSCRAPQGARGLKCRRE